MSLPGVFICGFPPLWAGLGETLGIYFIDQGLPPGIILHDRLKDFPEAARAVFDTLKRFHDCLPDVYKLFPLEVFFEDLVPPEAIPPTESEPVPQAEIIFIGTAIRPRKWSYTDNASRVYKLIG